MQAFLQPNLRLENVFSLFAFSASYTEDVIKKKHEGENIAAAFADDPANLKATNATLNTIFVAPELAPRFPWPRL